MFERSSRDNKYHTLSTKPGLGKRINESHWFLYWYHPYHPPSRMRVCLCSGMIRPHLSISFSSSNPTDKNNSKNHWFECLLCVNCFILPLSFSHHRPPLYYVLLTTFYKGRNQNWNTHSQQVVEADSKPGKSDPRGFFSSPSCMLRARQLETISHKKISKNIHIITLQECCKSCPLNISK